MSNDVMQRTKGTTFGPAWSMLFVPLLFIVAGLSLPYSFVAKRRTGNRERKFGEAMRAQGRIVDWDTFAGRVKASKGTLIVERFSFKGPVRWWWTPDNIYKQCPYPLADWLSMCDQREFQTTVRWFADRYTGKDGHAILVHATADQKRTVLAADGLSFVGDIRWVDIPPLKSKS